MSGNPVIKYFYYFSDVDWSPVEPNSIATCSVDTFTFIWDTRDCRKPQVSLQAVGKKHWFCFKLIFIYISKRLGRTIVSFKPSSKIDLAASTLTCRFV